MALVALDAKCRVRHADTLCELERFRSGLFKSPRIDYEGALKVDVVAKFCPQFSIIANSGVGCAHDLIARISRGKKVSLAFDNDHHEKPTVIRQLSKLILIISELHSSNSLPKILQFLIGSGDSKELTMPS